LKAILRVCASCEFIFRHYKSCPMCGFAHYGAHWVYGNATYRHEKTQKPYIDKKLFKNRTMLEKEINNIKKN